MNYVRICRECENEIFYKTKSQYNDAEKKNRICKKCSNRIKAEKIKYNGSLIKKCIECGEKYKFSSYRHYNRAKCNDEYLCKTCALKLTHTGKIISEELKGVIGINVKRAWENGSYENAKKMWSVNRSGINNPMYGSNRTGSLNPFYGKSHSAETKNHLSEVKKRENLSKYTIRKMSNAAKIRYINNGGMCVNYNPLACKIIDEYGKKHGYNFQHAENGGEYKIKIDNTYY